MKKKIFYLMLVLIAIELICRCIMFYSKVKTSYELAKGYYNFQGNLWEYAKEYKDFKKQFRGEDRLIVEDIFNRKFYNPGIELSLNWSKIKTNAFGMKEKKVNLQKKGDTYRIICLGSSYTLAGSSGKRFSDLLENKLNGKHKKERFEVINAGVSSQNILQGFMCFAMDWRILNPDMVIIDHVFDDVPANEVFYLKNYSAFSTVDKPGEAIREYLTDHIGIFALIDLVYTKYLEPVSSSGSITEEGLAYYTRVLESFVLLAKGTGAKVVLLSCGIAVDKEHNFEAGNPKRKMLELFFDGLSANEIVRCIEEYNNILKKVAEKNNVIFIDMSKAVPKDGEHFVDASHRSDKGNEVFASKLLDELITESVFK